jgi:hypothetical protein
MSGLELNAAKAEILALNTCWRLTNEVEYCSQSFEIKAVKELKIFGL